MQRLVVPETQPAERIDRVLSALCPDASRATVQRWIAEGRVFVRGNPCRAKDKVRPGDVIEYDPGPEPVSRAVPDPSVQFAVVHEDAHLLVVDKPAGLVVHPGRGNADGTLVNGLLARSGFERAPADPRDPEGYLRPGIVHRIDRDTSGLLIVAKDAPTREGLKRQFAEHSIDRAYLALTVGVPQPGRIDTLHGRHPKQRLKFSTRVTEGKRAVTEVSVLEDFAGLAALVRCTLQTGRTHQIRVHLAEVRRTPIMADALYGGLAGAPEVKAAAEALGRQALHAAVLGFEHPRTGERLRFESALPTEMTQALELLRDWSRSRR